MNSLDFDVNRVIRIHVLFRVRVLFRSIIHLGLSRELTISGEKSNAFVRRISCLSHRKRVHAYVRTYTTDNRTATRRIVCANPAESAL